MNYEQMWKDFKDALVIMESRGNNIQQIMAQSFLEVMEQFEQEEKQKEEK